MQSGYFYWTCQNHPDSNFSDTNIDGTVYAQSSHKAHAQVTDIIKNTLSEADRSIAVVLITPVNDIVREVHSIENISEIREIGYNQQSIVEVARKEVTDGDIREVGNRQHVDADDSITIEIDL